MTQTTPTCLWKDRIYELIREMPEAAEDEIGWRVVEELTIKGAELLKPIFDRQKGKNGRLSIQTDPGYLEWAGVAVFKKAYEIFKERGYRIRLLSAAFRNHMHWSEFIGGDVVISPPHKWQVRYNSSDVEVIPRIDKPVEPKIVDELLKKFVEFRKAYEEDGMRIGDFDDYGATVRTIRGFAAGCHQLAVLIRDFMLPNPDL